MEYIAITEGASFLVIENERNQLDGIKQILPSPFASCKPFLLHLGRVGKNRPIRAEDPIIATTPIPISITLRRCRLKRRRKIRVGRGHSKSICIRRMRMLTVVSLINAGLAVMLGAEIVVADRWLFGEVTRTRK